MAEDPEQPGSPPEDATGSEPVDQAAGQGTVLPSGDEDASADEPEAAPPQPAEPNGDADDTVSTPETVEAGQSEDSQNNETDTEQTGDSIAEDDGGDSDTQGATSFDLDDFLAEGKTGATEDPGSEASRDKPLFNEDGDLLDQDDIDALMAEASAGQKSTIFKPTGERYGEHEKINIEVYDFRNPIFLTEIELRQVRIRHENFIHYLAARIYMFLRMDFSMKMSRLATCPYAKFIESIPNPTHIALFKIDQLNGVGVIDINPRLALTIVNRMLGGKGHSVHEERYLTEIEMALMDDIMSMVLDEWCRQWDSFRELSTSLVGRENNGRFLQTAPHDAIMLVLDIESALGDCSEMLQIAVPYYMIEPIIREMQKEARRFGSSSSEEKHPKWLPLYRDIQVPVFAEWQGPELTVRDLLSLREGDVVELREDINHETRLRLRNVAQFKGDVGLEEDKVAVKITERIEDEEV